MISEINLKNIREGTLTGTIALELIVSDQKLTEAELDSILKLIENHLKLVQVLSIYVPKGTPDSVTLKSLGFFWSTFYRRIQIQVIAHAQVYKPWFKLAHWLTLKTLASNYTGVPANEYHVMFQESDLTEPDHFGFAPQTQMWVTVPSHDLAPKLFSWLVTKPANPWKILSPQKITIEKRLW